MIAVRATAAAVVEDTAEAKEAEGAKADYSAEVEER